MRFALSGPIAMIQDPFNLVGTTLAGKYAVTSVVEEGGFSIVYRATHVIWKRPVAIKAFRAVDALGPSARDQLLRAFIQEGALLGELSERSTAICQSRDIGTVTSPTGDWIPYLVLEWLEGESLEVELEEDRAAGLPCPSLSRAMAMLEPVALALELAHFRGICHLDLKPGNLFVLKDAAGQFAGIKLLDFGIAKVFDKARVQAGGRSSTETRTFTPGYAAPEQVAVGYGSTGPWTDVFALALLLVELTTGQVPLSGSDASELAAATLNRKERPTPRALGLSVSDAIEGVFLKALSVDPRHRYAHAGEFWRALREAAEADRHLESRATVPIPLQPRTSRRTSLHLQRVASESPPAAIASIIPVTNLTAAARPGRGKVVSFAAMIAVVAGSAAAFSFERFAQSNPSPDPHIRAPAAASFTRAGNGSAARCPGGMNYVPGGSFFMGADDASPAEKPAHRVTLSPFCMDVHEVTTQEFRACSDTGQCPRAGTTNDFEGLDGRARKAFDPLCNARETEGRAEHPVNCVTWQMAKLYCDARPIGARLPTEAEWEFAARGPSGQVYPWGDESPSPLRLNACGKECGAWWKRHGANVSVLYGSEDGWENTAPVGSYPAGRAPFGMVDMLGNVWEWVADYYAPYDASAVADPVGPKDGDKHVLRGGSWNAGQALGLRASSRSTASPATRSYGIGFRCAARPE